MDERTVNMVACVLWDLPFSGEDKPHTIDGLRGLQAVRIDCDIHFRPKLFESNAPKEIFEEQVAARLLEIGIRRTSDPSAPCLSVVIRCMQLPKRIGYTCSRFGVACFSNHGKCGGPRPCAVCPRYNICGVIFPRHSMPKWTCLFTTSYRPMSIATGTTDIPVTQYLFSSGARLAPTGQ